MSSELSQIVKKFFNNKYSRNDYLKFRELLFSQEEILEEQMLLHWEEYQKEKLSKQTDLSEIYRHVDQHIEKQLKEHRLERWLSTFSRVAAVLFLPLLLGLGILYFQFSEYLSQRDVYVEVSSPSGSRTSLNLPDGSSVWLNGDSYIRYPAVFSENRKVEIEGEAFFRVKSDASYPFMVHANEIAVKATGTEFNVFAYKEENQIFVILNEGSVIVEEVNGSELKEMQPGHQLAYHKISQDVQYSELNTSDYVDWINGKLSFKNASMTEVIRRMEHWYGIDIELVDQELEELHFRATFINENIVEALELLQSTAAFNYQLIKSGNSSDKSLEKTKILISKHTPML